MSLDATFRTFDSIGELFMVLPFLQADPIRSPAPAQDLILRQRVSMYRNGGLDREYENLGLEENFLYAYGFMTKELNDLLYPRPDIKLSDLDKQILMYCKGLGPIKSKDLESEFGTQRVVNGWGGYSRATRRSLENLHRAGHLRVVRRDRGVRVYEVIKQVREVSSLAERKRLCD